MDVHAESTVFANPADMVSGQAGVRWPPDNDVFSAGEGETWPASEMEGVLLEPADEGTLNDPYAEVVDTGYAGEEVHSAQVPDMHGAPTLRRGSRSAAVRRLQAALTTAGHPVGVDGDFGSATLAAVRAFQTQAGLAVDGVVGPATWDRLGASPTKAPGASAAGPLTAVATPLLSGATQNRYGIPETIEALAWIQTEWARRHPDVHFGVRDISRRGGGRLGKHKSHRVGLDADVTLIMNGRRIGVTSPDYEGQRPLVQELVEVICANPALSIKTIGFLDPKIKGVAPWPGHTKHLHVRFCRPERYTAALDLARVYAGAEAQPNYECGSASEFEEGHLDLYYEDDKERELALEIAVEESGPAEDEAEGILEPWVQGVKTVIEPLGRAALSALPQWRDFARPMQQVMKVVRSLDAGNRDEDSLTDLVFFDRFPAHRGGRPSPTDPSFAAWVEIRETVATPVLWGKIRTEVKRFALGEWQWWGQGTRLEDADAVQDRLIQYWAATPRMPTGGAIWQESWSAAFVSWILREAGVRAPFPFNNAHRVYVHWTIRRAIDKAHRIQGFPAQRPTPGEPPLPAGINPVKPREGDLVCTWRGRQATTYAELAGMANPPPGRALHCDMVTDVGADHIWVVGGNKRPARGLPCPLNPLPYPDGCNQQQQAAHDCGCTVNRARHPLTADGFLVPNPRWVAVVRIGP